MEDRSDWAILFPVLIILGIGAYSCDKDKKAKDQIDRIEAAAQHADAMATAVAEKFNAE